MHQSARLIGGAGTGKTTELMTIMAKLMASGVDIYQVGFVSLTRAAIRQAITRALEHHGRGATDIEDRGWFKTLHSICFRAMGMKSENMLTADRQSAGWWSEHFAVEAPPADGDIADWQYSVRGGPVEKSLFVWNLARQKIITVDEVYDDLVQTDSEMPSLVSIQDFVQKYERQKYLDSRMDFTDLLSRFSGIDFSSGAAVESQPDGECPGLPVWFFDESQDNSNLLNRVCARLSAHPECRWSYYAGDPFQCQPAGAIVRTVGGDVKIEDLDPDRDQLVAYNVKGSAVVGTGSKIKFETAWRYVDSGDIVETTCADGTVHLSTPNHQWVCRTLRSETKHATYLMKKGSRWRVGTVKMFSSRTLASDGKSDFRLRMRQAQEQADGIWILKITDSDYEARIYERVVAARYGIPTVTFRPPHGKTNLNKEFIDRIFTELGDLTPSGLKCLVDHGLMVEFPYVSDRSKNGGKASRKIRACNLIAGLVSMPKVTGRNVEWIEVTGVRRLGAGVPTKVYSLDVEKYHTYISNGFITGNSLYGFAGAAPHTFMNIPVDKQRIMPQSFRCPPVIHELGEAILMGCSDYFDRGIAPAQHEGTITRSWLRNAELDDDSDVPNLIRQMEGSVKILTRANYLCDSYAKKLTDAAIPWLPTRGHGGWGRTSKNIAMETLVSLAAGRAVDDNSWAKTLEHIPSVFEGKTLVERGTKSQWSDGSTRPGGQAVLQLLDHWGATDILKQLIISGEWTQLIEKSTNYVEASSRVPDEVRNPRVELGTIHSVKGQEADNVILDLRSTRKCYDASANSVSAADEELRVCYVGVTRARRTLTMLRPNRGFSLPIS